MTQAELDEVLVKHKEWLNNEDGGERADLRHADLRGAKPQGADLRHADLQSADLQSADQHGAQISTLLMAHMVWQSKGTHR